MKTMPARELPSTASITQAELARMGEGQVAYIKPMRSEEVLKAFPGAKDLRPGMKLFALLAADGSPIMLTDSRDVAMNSAWEHELATVQVH
jgi:hypothetical protein